MAFPQEPEKQEKAAEAKKSGEMQQEQNPKVDASTNDEDKETSLTLFHSIRGFGEGFLLDQKQIWTSPARLRWQDTNWLIPLSGVTLGLFVTDAEMSRHISHNPATISHYNTASNAAVGALLGGAGAMWLLSYPKHEQHWRGTGFLAAEAAVNSVVVVEAMKYPLGRQRPFQGDGSGEFFKGGASFPSEHAAAAWAVAGVVAHEYPGPLTKILVYSLASLVDYSRYRERQHFPSDVFVGSIVGSLVAQNIYSRRYDPELGGDDWGSIGQFMRDSRHSLGNQGSPYVPEDSWVYPVFERLAAMGYVNSGIFGMRPWTRLECARLVNEAGEQIDARGSEDTQARRLYDVLAREFSSDLAILSGQDNRSLRLESVYTRVTGISGPPLTNGMRGYYFGQTLDNDFGRPYSEGFNSNSGFSGWASDGPLSAYIRGEYQQAPSIPALPLGARQFISVTSGDDLPLPPGTPTPEASQFQLLDTYFALTVENWQLSYGKQTLWWGPSLGGPMMFSDNAAPVTMFQINRVSPFKFPWVFGVLGPMRFQFILGQLSGHEFVYGSDTGLIGHWGQFLNPQPMIDGPKFNFKPTSNFEFGVSFTDVFGGPGAPFTWHRFLKTFSISKASNGLTAASDSGDRRGGVDFSYRVPELRNWLTFYGDAFTEDEYSPLGYPRKSAYQGGIYLPRIPGIPKLDLRLEGGSTEPADFSCKGCFYFNTRYRNSYTNKDNLMGSWLGRDGQGEQAWSTYWLSSRSTIQFHFRHQKAVAKFVTNGGTINDVGVSTNVWLSSRWELSGLVQYEKWDYPILAPGPQTNVTTSLGISFAPVGGHLQP
jgi:membrane-associated phospholipid phosphatase